MKKIISTIIAGILFASCAASTSPHNAFADSMQKDDFVYNEAGKITSYTGDNGICEIPEDAEVNSLKGNPIKKLIVNKGVKLSPLPASAQTTLKEAEFKEGVTEVDYRYFEDCEALEKVTLPSSLTKIGDRAFMNCKRLKTIEWSDGLQSIGEYAFYGTSPSGDIIMPDTVTYVGDSAFSDCGSLDKVHLSDNITNVPKSTWFAGTEIKEINIPDALLDNPPVLSAQEITFNSDMTVKIFKAVRDSSWCNDKYLKGKTDKSTGNYEDYAVVENTVLKYISNEKNPIIPEGIKSITEYAFAYRDIDTVTFPTTLESIDSSAFAYTTLKEVTIPKNVKVINDGAFRECPLIEKVTFEGAPEVGNAFHESGLLTKENVIIKDKSIKLSKDFYDFIGVENNMDSFYNQLAENGTVVENASTPVPTKLPEETAAPEPSAEPTAAPTLAPTAAPTPSAEPRKLYVENGETPVIKVDGETVDFPDAKPFIDGNGRTQVPVRALSEMLDAKVDWSQETHTAAIEKNGKTVSLTLGSNIMLVGGDAVEMDTEVIMKEDRIFIPVRFAAEALGLTVVWKD